MTPALAVIVLLNATLTRFIGEGPLWGSIDMDTNNCRNYWWSTLLYVQNYVSPEEMVRYFIIIFDVYFFF